MESSYATRQEAVEAGQVAKGWIPRWVPASATNLREIHNLDSNASALAFDLPGGTRLMLPPDCTATAHELTFPVYYKLRWWPDEAELERRFTTYRCSADAAQHVYVAIRDDRAHVLHWRTYAR